MSEQTRTGQNLHPQFFLLIFCLYNFFFLDQYNICYVRITKHFFDIFNDFILDFQYVRVVCAPFISNFYFISLFDLPYILFIFPHSLCDVYVFLFSFIYGIATFQHQIIICLLEIFHFRSFLGKSREKEEIKICNKRLNSGKNPKYFLLNLKQQFFILNSRKGPRSFLSCLTTDHWKNIKENCLKN